MNKFELKTDIEYVTGFIITQETRFTLLKAGTINVEVLPFYYAMRED